MALEYLIWTFQVLVVRILIPMQSLMWGPAQGWDHPSSEDVGEPHLSTKCGAILSS